MINLTMNALRNRGLAVLLAGLLPLACWAASKGPDSGNYSATDATVFSFVDISGAGGGTSVLQGTDDGMSALNLPFSFTFYGQNYNVVCASTNGVLYFVTSANTCSSLPNDFANSDLSVSGSPGGTPAAMPFWTDLTFQIPGADAVYYQTLGASGSRRFIVQWNNAFPQGSPNPVTFQAILTEGSNSIAFQYQSVNLGSGNPASKGAQATVGISGSAAPTLNQQLQWSYDVPVLSNSYALLFTFTAPPAPPSGGSGGGGGGGGAGPIVGSLTASPTTLTLNVPTGAKGTQTVTLTYQNVFKLGPSLQANVTTSNSNGVSWLSVSPASAPMTLASFDGTTFTYTATVTVTADAARFGAGNTVGGTVNFTAVDGSAPAPAASTSVTMAVTDLKLSTAPQSLTFTYRLGDPNTPASQPVSVSSIPAGITFSASASTTSGGAWLSVPATTGTTPGSLPVSVNVANLAAGSYTGKVTVAFGANTMNVPVTLTVIPANSPLITQGGIVPVYSTVSSIQTGSWVSIYGTNLADAAVQWNGDFPTTLGGVSVTVDGNPAYLWYVSPTQINLQVPDDTSTGTVNVVVTTSHGSSTSTVTLAQASPSFSLLDGTHAAGVIVTPDGSGTYGSGGYDVVGPAGSFSFSTRPVKAGEVLELFGVGFGPTNPAVPAGQVFTGQAPTVNPVAVTIGGVPAKVTFAGLTGAGLYQINVTVPNVSSGDQALQATVNGVQTQSGPVVTIQ